MIKIAEVETLDHLKEFVAEHMPDFTVDSTGDEVVIRTGAGYDMGGMLHPLNEED